MRPILFGLAVWLCAVVAPVGAVGVLADALRDRLDSPGSAQQTFDGETIRAAESLRRFYARREFSPLWSTSAGEPLLLELMGAIQEAESHGLRATDYHLTALEQARQGEDREAVELLATDSYLTLAAHLLEGRVDPLTVEPDWTAAQRERDLVEHLEAAVQTGQVAASLAALEPQAPAYRELKKALVSYRSAIEAGGWESVPDGPALKLGARGGRVVALRSRLNGEGLLPPSAAEGDEFDIDVESAVADFQRRLGLEPDGVVGVVTLRELNRSPTERVNQIRANLERWRWLPDSLGERHVRVNIADYRLEAWNAEAVELTHDVIVGRNYRRTPVFSDRIAYLVFNPWWETPASIARQDKLPEFQKAPALVAQGGYQLIDRSGQLVDPLSINWGSLSARDFPYRLRQAPGPRNALGRVKIMFPNRHNVYLHDTPGRDLFRRAERTLSSGCIRVSDPLTLTEWLLRDEQGWPRSRIEAVVGSGVETRVNLSRRVPVHILYFTAVFDSEAGVRLLSDVYSRDARVVAALDRPPPATGE